MIILSLQTEHLGYACPANGESKIQRNSVTRPSSHSFLTDKHESWSPDSLCLRDEWLRAESSHGDSVMEG